MYASESKLSKELKNYIGILVGQATFKLWIKTVKILFWSISQELLGLLKFLCYLWVPWTIYCKIYHFSKGVDDFKIAHKTCLFLGGSYNSNGLIFLSERCIVSMTSSWKWRQHAFLLVLYQVCMLTLPSRAYTHTCKKMNWCASTTTTRSHWRQCQLKIVQTVDIFGRGRRGLKYISPLSLPFLASSAK